MKTILVVDDEPKIVQIAQDYLQHSGFNVVTASDGKIALQQAKDKQPDLIVLDLGLPNMDGLDVTRAIRKESNTPIIMLTARGEESDKLVGLELGADDYMVKPFSPKELVARVRVVLRRTENQASQNNKDVLRLNGIEIDVSRMTVQVNQKPVEMTNSEFQLLLTLAQQPGRLFTRSQLLDAVRGVTFESYERAIDAHIKNIRRKIEADPRDPKFILTIYGVGYKFAEN